MNTDIVTEAIEAVERRAWHARVTMSHVCAKAGVPPQSWSNAKSKKRIGVNLLKRVEEAMSKIEQQASAPAQ